MTVYFPIKFLFFNDYLNKISLKSTFKSASEKEGFFVENFLCFLGRINFFTSKKITIFVSILKKINNKKEE